MASMSFQIAGKTPRHVNAFIKATPNASYREIRKAFDLPADPDDRSEEISELKTKFIKKLKNKFDDCVDFFIKQAPAEQKIDAKKFKNFLRRYKVVALACENLWEEMNNKSQDLVGDEKEKKLRLDMKKCLRETKLFDHMVSNGFYESFLTYQKQMENSAQRPMNMNASDISDAEIVPPAAANQNARPKSNKH